MKRNLLLIALLANTLTLFAQIDFKNSQDRFFVKLGARNFWQKSIAIELYLKRKQSLNTSVSWGQKNGEASGILTTFDYQNYRETHLNSGYRFYAIAQKRGIFRLFIEPGACIVRQTGEIYSQTFLQGASHDYFNSLLFGLYAITGLQLNFKYVAFETSIGGAKMLNEKINPVNGEIWPNVNLSIGVGFALY
jgi:hypothetical protein